MMHSPAVLHMPKGFRHLRLPPAPTQQMKGTQLRIICSPGALRPGQPPAPTLHMRHAAEDKVCSPGALRP
eukprot:1139488-Pelagomonas_calceolata.AAC.8